MALLPIITVLVIALLIGVAFSNGFKKKEIKKLKRKKKLASKLTIIIPVYFIVLLIPTIWVQTVSSKSTKEFDTVSIEEYERISKLKNQEIKFRELKENDSIELSESKRFKISDEPIYVDGEENDLLQVCIVESDELKGEIVVSSYRERNFIDSNGEMYDISRIVPFDSYELDGNRIKVSNEGLNTKVVAFNSSYDFNMIDRVSQFKGVLIEVPNGTKVKEGFRVVLIKE